MKKVDKNKISIKFGDFLLAENGSPVENIDIDKIREYMKWDSIVIEINLNLGSELLIAIHVILHMIILI